MKLLFLRGRVPQDRDSRQIIFNTLDECDDIWTQLASQLSIGGYGEIWYWGGKRKHIYRNNFIESWVKSYDSHNADFIPDVIFARGGFPEYDVVLKKYPRAFKIYYGAGKRFMPQSAFQDYNLILVDTPEQYAQTKAIFPNSRVEMFIKPAADNVFQPKIYPKKYDVIFCSNEHKKGIKGHDFILPNLPADIKMVQVGIISDKLKSNYPNVSFTGWIPRSKIPDFYGMSKVAVVCCSNIDSCPRIIPEALACNCPVLLLDSVNVWKDKYITSETGRIASPEYFIDNLREMIKDYRTFSPNNYYNKNLSISVATSCLKNFIDGGA